MDESNKLAAARAAIEYLQDGMVIGLGSGSTANHFIRMLARQLENGELRNVTGVPTSEATSALARSLGIPLTSLNEMASRGQTLAIDIAVDGADEVDPDNNLIKGLGRALLREKLIEAHARQFVVIVGDEKISSRLGTRVPLPVEVVRFEVQASLSWLNSLGCRAELMLESNHTPVITDNGNFLSLCYFDNGIEQPGELANTLAQRPGIVEHGLFLDMADQVIIASSGGISFRKRPVHAGRT